MVNTIFGDAVTTPGDILVHQVNYEGVMGGGIALTIRRELLSDADYTEYVRRCAAGGKFNLGTVLWSKLTTDALKKFVANCFCQLGEENGPEDFADDGGITDYTAMRRCFEEVRSFALRRRLSVIIPGRIGCGIAGGDWARVSKLIDDVFMDAPIDVRVCFQS